MLELYQREGDVKILNCIYDLPLLHEILSTGRVILERDRDFHRNFVARTVIAYLDFEPILKRNLKAFARSLRRG